MRVGAYDLVADYHTHTTYSHGTGSVIDNVTAARERGLETVAISEHGPANLFGVGTRSLETFAAIREDVERARAAFSDINVLFGVEANVISEEGELDIPLPMQEIFDVVLVGLHPLVRWRPLGAGVSLVAQTVFGAWTGLGAVRSRERNTRAIVNAVRRNRVHIVTHPGYRLPIDTRRLAEACAEVGCAMEISASHAHTSVAYIRIAQEAGARFAIGSDAHSPERVGELERGVRLAEAAGLPPELIVNARAKGMGSALPNR